MIPPAVRLPHAVRLHAEFNPGQLVNSWTACLHGHAAQLCSWEQAGTCMRLLGPRSAAAVMPQAC
jgi:hypothetical protein